MGALMFHLKIKYNFVVPNIESVDPKFNALLWLCNMKKKMTIILKIKEGTRHRGQTNFRT